MDYFLISALSNTITSLSLGAIVYFKGKQKHVKTTYVLTCLSLAVWSFFYLLWQLSESEKTAILFCKASMLGAIFIPTFWFHNILHITDHTQKYFTLLKTAYLSSLIFSILNSFGFIVAGVAPKSIFLFWPIPGPFLHAQLFMLIFYIGLCEYILYKSYLKFKNIQRKQMKYLFIATLITFLGGITNYFLWYDIPIPPYGNISPSIALLLVAYAILKYKILDTHWVLREYTVKLLFAISMSVPCALILYFSPFIFLNILSVMVCLFLSLVFFKKIENHLIASIDKLPPFKKFEKRMEQIKKFQELITETRTINECCDLIVTTLKNYFKIEKISILILEPEKKSYWIRAGIGIDNAESKLFCIQQNDVIYQQLHKKNKIIVKETLIHSSTNEENLIKEMSFFSAEISIPITINRQLFGVIHLGNKYDSFAYSESDLADLHLFARTIEHTLHSLKRELQQKLYSSSLAHDLSKPFSSKTGIFHKIEQILSEKYGPVTHEQMQYLHWIQDELQFTSRFVKDLINPQAAFKDFDSKIQPASLRMIYFRTQKRYEEIVDSKNIQFTVTPPDEDILMACDSHLIEYGVILNLMDNAIRYVPENGKIELGFKIKDEFFVGHVSDSGPGIEPRLQNKIFNAGEQGSQTHRGEAGLGLFNVKNILKTHKGKIVLDSAPGKGSTFYFYIPLAKTTLTLPLSSTNQ